MKIEYLIIIGLYLAGSSGTANPQLSSQIDSLSKQSAHELENLEILMQLGLALHDAALDGKKEAVGQGIAVLDRVLKRDSLNVHALVYLGSLYTLKARDASMPWSKIKYGKRGFALIDRAVKMQSDDMDIRLTRAINSYMVPDFMGRLATGLGDFETILASPDFQQWPAPKRAFVFLNFGKAYEKNKKIEKAREFYRIAFQEAPDSNAGRQAGELLK